MIGVSFGRTIVGSKPLMYQKCAAAHFLYYA